MGAHRVREGRGRTAAALLGVRLGRWPGRRPLRARPPGDGRGPGRAGPRRGSGLVGIACALRGAASVTAAEIDAYAVAAIGLNAAANGVRIDARCADLLPGDGAPAEVVLA
ncbi:50S ribosomal protein L11 methyltransferase [Kitasatospora arboriphila]